MANSQEPQDSSGDSSAGEGIRRPEGKTAIIDTDYVIGQDNISARALGINLDLHGKVFTISSIVVLLFVFLTLAFQAQVEQILSGVRDWLTGNLSWVFLIAVDFFVVVCIGLILSPLGKVRLGGPDAKPDFSYFGWFAMLFAAGMGIGLVFYGVSEPMSHFGTSLAGPAVGADGIRTDFAPLGGAAGDEAGALSLGMAATIYHWGLHPWAIYSLVALALALFSFNKGLPLTIRSIFYPILGERVWGWPGHCIDILAVFWPCHLSGVWRLPGFCRAALSVRGSQQ
jgi:BCCT family betaine/carnitine transporter